jgi:hypothetical protein
MDINDCKRERGIFYIATGENYVAEAKRSAQTLQDHTSLPIGLITDKDIDDQTFDITLSLKSPNYDYTDKFRCLIDTPFKQTLFLDTDTYIIGNITDMFSSLERFDLLVSVDQYEGALRRSQPDLFPEVPNSFPEFNTGVLAFNKNESILNLFSNWMGLYEDHHKHDQLAFRAALYNSDIRFSPISNLYNTMFSGAHLEGEVRILHDFGRRLSDIDDSKTRETIDNINRNQKSRLLVTPNVSLIPIPPLTNGYSSKLGKFLLKNNCKTVIIKILDIIRELTDK